MLHLPTTKRQPLSGAVKSGPMKGMPLASQASCEVLLLAVRYEKLVRQYDKSSDAADTKLWRAMQNIAERVSWMAPRSLDGAMFQIMLASASLDSIRTGSTSEIRQRDEARANRLLYRAIEKLGYYNDDWGDLKDWLMPVRCDQKKPLRGRRTR